MSQRICPETSTEDHGQFSVDRAGPKSRDFWVKLLDQNGDGLVDAYDLKISLYKSGTTIDPEAFHEVVSDPCKLADHVDGDTFARDIDSYHNSIETRQLMDTTQYTLKRWLALTFFLGWAFLDTVFFPKSYYGKGPVHTTRMKFIWKYVGVISMITTLFLVVIPSFLANAMGVFHDGLLTMTKFYFIYHVFGYSLLRACGEGANHSLAGVNQSHSTYFSVCSFRYDRCRQKDGSWIYGHDLYSQLKEEIAAALSKELPPHFDHEEEISKESTRRNSSAQKLKKIEAANPFAMGAKHKTSIAFAGLCYVIGISYYPQLRGLQPWPESTIEIILQAIITLASLLGLYGSFFGFYYRSASCYKSCVWRTMKFRKNTTAYSLRFLGQWIPSEEGVQQQHLDFNIIRDEQSMHAFINMHEILFIETRNEVLHFEAINNCLIVQTIVMVSILLLLSFLYRPEFEQTFVILIVFAMLNIFVLATVLLLVVRINEQLHNYFLKDLERIRWRLVKKGGEDGLVKIIDNQARALKVEPKLAGRMLSVKITKSLVVKLLISLFAAMASAILRLGLT